MLLSEVGPSYLGGPSLSLNSTELLDQKHIINIFPNPTTTSFSIETSSTFGELLKVTIYNLNGQLVKKDADFQKKSSHYNQYDVSDLNNGIYFVKLVSEKTSRTMKLIINK